MDCNGKIETVLVWSEEELRNVLGRVGPKYR